MMTERSAECNASKYDETFKAVLSTTECKLYPSPEHQYEPKTPKLSTKKRRLNMDKEQRINQKKRRESIKDRLLEWNNFYTSEKFGIFIQCTKCNKWRREMEYEEDHEVPKDWCCSMSLSGIKGCDDPENVEEADFCEVDFIPGSIVWARLEGYPWWPGMIEDDPDTEEYYWIEGRTCYYNVTFLDDKVSHAWVPATFVCSFLKPPIKRMYLNTRFKKSKYFHLLEAAEKKAKEAISMSIKERLQNFSFAHRYNGKWPIAPELDEEEDTKNITEMLIKDVRDIESIKSSDSDYRSDASLEPKENETSDDLNSHENLPGGIQVKSKYGKTKTNKNKLNFEVCPDAEAKTMARNDDDTCITQNNKKSTVKFFKKFLNTADNFVKSNSKTIKSTETQEALVLPLNERNVETKIVSSITQDKVNITTNESKTDENKSDSAPIPKTKKQSKRVNAKEKKDLTDAKENKDKIPDIKKKRNTKGKKNPQEMEKEIDEIKVDKKSIPNYNKPIFKPPIKDNRKSNLGGEDNVQKLQQCSKTSNEMSPNDSDSNMKNSMCKELSKCDSENITIKTDDISKQEISQSSNMKLSLSKTQIPDKFQFYNDEDKNGDLHIDLDTRNEDNTENSENSKVKEDKTQIEIRVTKKNLKKNIVKDNLKEDKAQKKMDKMKHNMTEINPKSIITESPQKSKIAEVTKKKENEKNLKSFAKCKSISSSDTKTNLNIDCSDNMSERSRAKISNQSKDNYERTNTTFVEDLVNLKNEKGTKKKPKSINNFSDKGMIKIMKKVDACTKDLENSTPNTANSKFVTDDNKNKKRKDLNIANTNMQYDNESLQAIKLDCRKEDKKNKKIINTSELSLKDNDLTENEKNNLCISDKTKNDAAPNKTDSEEVEIISISDDDTNKVSCNVDEGKKHFSLSFIPSTQHSENEDSDPFEAD